MTRRISLALTALFLPFSYTAESDWTEASRRAAIYSECGQGARRMMHGWIERNMDPETALYSRGGVWNYHNEGADHYSSMVLMAHYVEPELNEPGAVLHRTLTGIGKYCSTPNGIPALYDLRRRRQIEPAQLGHLSEWLKDGLIRACEIKGVDNDWYRELIRLTDAMLAEAERRGGIAAAFAGAEPSGNMLQALPRLYVMSGDEKYLRAAEAIADALLLGSTSALDSLMFRDHGNENVPGLGELFALEGRLKRPKLKQYEPPMRALLDRIVRDYAHPSTGFLCQTEINDGTRTYRQPEDTWGYSVFTFDNYDQATGTDRYAEEVEKPLRWFIEHRTHYYLYWRSLWPKSFTRDMWSDSHESFVILWSRHQHVGDGRVWLDWATTRDDRRTCGDQQYGPYRAVHDDGSTGRNLCSHMHLQSCGVRMLPFREGAGVGAVRDGEALRVIVSSNAAWSGRLYFEPDRHTFPAGRIDWARINEMVAQYVVKPKDKFSVKIGDGAATRMEGQTLLGGLAVELPKAGTLRIEIERDVAP